jgi:uncharacterized protein (TIGR02145 family)
MKISWRTEGLPLACCLLLGLFGCGHPVPHEHIQCGGEYAKNGRITGSGATPHLQANEFGPLECRVMDKGYGGSAALRAFRGGPCPSYTVPDLVPGAYYRLNAHQIGGTQGRLRVCVRQGQRLVWDLAQALTQPRDKGRLVYSLDWAVPKEFAGMTMEVRLEAGPADSVALFENFSIYAFPSSLLAGPGRSSHWVDARDGHRYRVVHLAQRWWLAEDLVYQADSTGAYTYAQARAALPAALRLPTDADWDALEAATGMRPRNPGEAQPYVHTPSLRVGGHSGFDVLPVAVTGYDSLYIRYWSGSPADGGSRWIRHFGSDIRAVRMQSAESQRIHVRAILQAPGLEKQ